VQQASAAERGLHSTGPGDQLPDPAGVLAGHNLSGLHPGAYLGYAGCCHRRYPACHAVG
ncbi:unnamed protein product, partial [Polarella glacialis]